jgi:streptomycin 6-kinase
VSVGRRLCRPAAAPFRRIGDHLPRWLDNAERDSRPGSALVPLARELYAGLEPGQESLVHGDFHHHNILSSARGHVAIDAKPMLAEPEFDVATFLWNPLPYRIRTDVSEGRLAAFAAAGLRQDRMRAWAVIRTAYLGAEDDETSILTDLVRVRGPR